MATNGENGYVSHEYLDKDVERGPALNKIRTAGAVSLSPELFEKLYLQPRESAGKSGIRHYLGNPTPIGLVGFLLCLTPLSNILMGWHGAGPYLGLAAMGAYFFFGGGMMTVCGVFEVCVSSGPHTWFPRPSPSFQYANISDSSFAVTHFRPWSSQALPASNKDNPGAFWLTYAVTLQDGVYGIVKGYPNQAAFMNEFAYILLWMGFLCFLYMIAALRTNAAFVVLFLWLMMTFVCLAGTFFQTYNGAAALAGRLQIAGGAFAFLACIVGWWILLSLLLAAVDFPVQIPLGDLTSIVPGYKSRHTDSSMV
ncbi:uncharacterized protein PG998_005834 [Apiospora kogelbergensis]|uniref:uncharacterized protein n=1 Tax=Apiospora kogelbergensis TaxID=1337665 RepID=UPI00312D380E